MRSAKRYSPYPQHSAEDTEHREKEPACPKEFIPKTRKNRSQIVPSASEAKEVVHRADPDLERLIASENRVQTDLDIIPRDRGRI